MIKRILPDELKRGMFIESAVHEEEAGKEESVDFIKNVLVDTNEKLERFSKGRLKFLYIDTKKSVKIEAPPKPEPKPVVAITQAREPKPEREPEPEITPVSFEEEIEAATVFRNEARDVVADYMEDARVGKSLDSKKLKEQSANLVDSLFRNPDALTSLTRLKSFDDYTFTHSVNVAVLVTSFANRLGFNRGRLERLATGALLHDVGKMRIPDEVLNKPGRFTDAERKIMMDHPVFSREILDKTEGIHDDSKRVALEHHERLDGRGYPYGLTESELHIDTNIISICDVYDAFSSKRVYKPAMPLPQCLAFILERSDTEFKRNLVESFIKLMGVYPVGSLVELTGGEFGVVVEANNEDASKPWVLVIQDKRGHLIKKPERILIGDFTAGGRKIVRPLDPEKMQIDPNKWLPAGPAN